MDIDTFFRNDDMSFGADGIINKNFTNRRKSISSAQAESSYMNADGEESALADINKKLRNSIDDCGSLKSILQSVKDDINAYGLEKVKAKAKRKKEIDSIVSGLQKGKSKVEARISELNCDVVEQEQADKKLTDQLNLIAGKDSNDSTGIYILASGILLLGSVTAFLLYRKFKKK